MTTQTEQDEVDVRTAILAFKSEYLGKHVALDLMIERYEYLRVRAYEVYELSEDTPVYTGPNGALCMHPSYKPWIELEKLLFNTLKELTMSARIEDMNSGSELSDEVDTFLESIERTNRPHRSVNRGAV